MSDIENFLCGPTGSKGVLLFPPVNKYRRFLIHKLIEESFPHYDLQTLSVGQDSGRRTAVFIRSLLRPNFKPPTTANQVSRQRASALVAPMISKNSDKSKSRTPYGGIYRPPAVRRLLDTKLDVRSDELNSTCDTQLTATPVQPEMHAKVAQAQQTIPSPAQPTMAAETPQIVAASTPPPCSSERKSARVKRPDRQMYVPRPKRLSSKDETSTSSQDRTDKSEPKAKVFISEKRSRVKVRKKSVDNDEIVCRAESPDITHKIVESVVSVSEAELNSSIEQSFSSLDNSFVFESSQKSIEPIDSSFHTCPEDSFSENGRISDIEPSDSSFVQLCDEKLSFNPDSKNLVSEDVTSSANGKNSVPEDPSVNFKRKVPFVESGDLDVFNENSNFNRNCEISDPNSPKIIVEDASLGVEMSSSVVNNIVNLDEDMDDSKCSEVAAISGSDPINLDESIDNPNLPEAIDISGSDLENLEEIVDDPMCSESAGISECGLVKLNESIDDAKSSKLAKVFESDLVNLDKSTDSSKFSKVPEVSGSDPISLDESADNSLCSEVAGISGSDLISFDESTDDSFCSKAAGISGCDVVCLSESTDDSTCSKVAGILDISTESEDADSPIRRNIRERALAKSPEAVADDWELLLNESGQFFDPSLLKELEDAVGKVSISRPTCNYKEFQTVEERSSDGESIIEIYGFSSELRTHDLMNIFSPLCGKNFQIAWVDDTHALGVFSSPLIADELLSTELPFVRTRPLSEGIPESRFKARKLVLPPMTRPKTCPALARRLVTGALGLRLPTSKLEREAERKVLKEARDKKRQEAKIRRDIWEGN